MPIVEADVADADHGPDSVYFDNLRVMCALSCSCGYQARGDTWEEAGADMDMHLDGLS